MLQHQVTLAQAVSYTGIGLHSGQEVQARFCPAPVDTGIVIVRTDLPGRPEIHAQAANVTSTLRATTIEENGCKVFTIEHFISGCCSRQGSRSRMRRGMRWSLTAFSVSMMKRRAVSSWPCLMMVSV